MLSKTANEVHIINATPLDYLGWFEENVWLVTTVVEIHPPSQNMKKDW